MLLCSHVVIVMLFCCYVVIRLCCYPIMLLCCYVVMLLCCLLCCYVVCYVGNILWVNRLCVKSKSSYLVNSFESFTLFCYQILTNILLFSSQGLTSLPSLSISCRLKILVTRKCGITSLPDNLFHFQLEEVYLDQNSGKLEKKGGHEW